MEKVTRALSGRELDIMKILWKEEVPVGASQIAQLGSLSINTVQAVLKGLLADQYIKVADIGYSGTVLSRKYAAVLTADCYIKDNLLKFTNLKSAAGIFASLLENEVDVQTINKLEDLLKERKKELHIK